jgi:PLP dependent protein
MIKENIKKIKEIISSHAKKSGRMLDDINIIAVTKTVGVNELKEALESGINIFGENKVQEALEKSQELGFNVNWHLIGHLQSNKAKKAVELFELIHSVDSMSLLLEISKYARSFGKTQDVLIEVNTSGEESKFGIKPNEVGEFFDSFVHRTNPIENIKIRGLMTMAPFTIDENIIRTCFKNTKKMFDELKEKFKDNKNISMDFLSMGMSNDYHIAVEEGSNMVRIGTAIFGERK